MKLHAIDTAANNYTTLHDADSNDYSHALKTKITKIELINTGSADASYTLGYATGAKEDEATAPTGEVTLMSFPAPCCGSKSYDVELVIPAGKLPFLKCGGQPGSCLVESRVEFG